MCYRTNGQPKQVCHYQWAQGNRSPHSHSFILASLVPFLHLSFMLFCHHVSTDRVHPGMVNKSLSHTTTTTCRMMGLHDLLSLSAAPCFSVTVITGLRRCEIFSFWKQDLKFLQTFESSVNWSDPLTLPYCTHKVGVVGFKLNAWICRCQVGLCYTFCLVLMIQSQLKLLELKHFEYISTLMVLAQSTVMVRDNHTEHTAYRKRNIYAQQLMDLYKSNQNVSLASGGNMMWTVTLVQSRLIHVCSLW